MRDPADGLRKVGRVWFDSATFEGDAHFDGVLFEGDAMFRWATFKGLAGFDRASFTGEAGFDEVTFEGVTVFERVVFEALAWFGETAFEVGARFDEANFMGDAVFNDVTSKIDAGFHKATFATATHLGPLVCDRAVDFTDAVFSAAATLEIEAQTVACQRSRWASHATLRFRHAAVDLSDVVLEFPFSVAAHPPFHYLSEICGESQALDELGLSEERVRVVSLSGSDASHIVLSDIDLSECRFAGTIRLDQLRLYGRCSLATTPSGLHHRGLRPVRWTSRQTLAEEQTWRAANGHAGWTRGTGDHSPLQPAALAPVYRDLRKSFEDAKNEPGAADFYYGEMEMRRHNRDAPAAERALLWLYWAISGYGLRASRALGWLLAAMTVTVLLMVGFGLPDTPAEPYPRTAGVIGKQNPTLRAGFADRFTTARTHKAVDVVVNSVVFRSSGQSLTTAGRYTEMASRFTEPILLGLALLAVRGRLKRG